MMRSTIMIRKSATQELNHPTGVQHQDFRPQDGPQDAQPSPGDQPTWCAASKMLALSMRLTPTTETAQPRGSAMIHMVSGTEQQMGPTKTSHRAPIAIEG